MSDIDTTTWLRNASDLLLEPDPGPTPFAIEGLLVEKAIGAMVGPPKVGKTWALLECALAIVTGREAFGHFAVPTPGPVIVVLEESGEVALRRRLDRLVRGYALEPATLDGLYVAANRRVRLNDPGWQRNLVAAGQEIGPRAIFLDPLARLKGATVDENVQRELGPVLDFLRDLRNATNAAVVFVHHVGHTGSHARGSSDIESYWESKITVGRQDGASTLNAEHREAEAIAEFRYRLDFDQTTQSLRLDADQRAEKIREEVAAFLAEHPRATANEVAEAVRGRRIDVLAEVKAYRALPPNEAKTRFPFSGNHTEPVGSAPHTPLVPTIPLSPRRGRGSGTAAAGAGSERPFLGDELYPLLLAEAGQRGHVFEDEFTAAYALHRLVERSRKAVA